jgi:UDP-2-acetamido-2,6-beta-L-arabino-hexul-4-ose reductase
VKFSFQNVDDMRILITGANGFIGKNVQLRLGAIKGWEVLQFTRDNNEAELPELVARVDAVIHLAGINRTTDPAELLKGNTALTGVLCDAIDLAVATNHRPLFIHASSIQVTRDNQYGRSKLAAEQRVRDCIDEHGLNGHIFRLPNVFGKWCRQEYNSVVATFCYNISRNLPIRIDDPATQLELVYVDDVIDAFLTVLEGHSPRMDQNGFSVVAPTYHISLQRLADLLYAFRESRRNHVVERVGDGLIRALYSTYLSYLEPADFSYDITRHGDERGIFAEMLRTRDSGQISFFTAGPGVTRGGHYHHTKSEKFLVIKGQARFRFRHMHTGEYHELFTNDSNLRIVETVPGWTHDITNIGDNEMLVMLWANEQFDAAHPDTYISSL